jgi:hypothetical protein
VSNDWKSDLITRYAPWLDELGYGIECRDGWRDLVETTLAEIARSVGPPAECPELRLTRVRRKFGWLVCQHQGLLGDRSLAVDRVLARALARSSETCELCGKPGRQRDEDVVRDYWTVECDECRAGGNDG